MDQWRQTWRSYVSHYSGYWHLNTCWFSNEGLPIFQTGIVVLWPCSCISNFDKLVFQFPGGKPWVGQLVTGAGKSGLPQDSTRLEAARWFPEMLHEDLRHHAKTAKQAPPRDCLLRQKLFTLWCRTTDLASNKNKTLWSQTPSRATHNRTLHVAVPIELRPFSQRRQDDVGRVRATGAGWWVYPPTRGAWWVGGGWLVAAEGRRILQQVCQRSRNRCAWLGGAGTAGWCCTVCGKILYNAMFLEDAPLANVEFAPYQCFNPIGNLYTLYLLSVGLTHLQLCSCSLNQVLSGIRWLLWSDCHIFH